MVISGIVAVRLRLRRRDDRGPAGGDAGDRPRARSAGQARPPGLIGAGRLPDPQLSPLARGSLRRVPRHPRARRWCAGASRCGSSRRATRGRAGEEELDGVPVRRVRYASAARRDPGLPRRPWRPRSGRPAGWRRWPGSGARFGAPPARSWRAGADLIHAHWWVPGRPGRAARRPAGPDRPRHRRGAAPHARGWPRRLARPVFAPGARSSPPSRASSPAGSRTPPGRHIAAAHVHPMPVDTADLALDHGRRRRHRRLPAHAAEADPPGHRDHRRSWPRAATTCRSPIVGDGPERDALERQVERLGIAPFVRFAGAVAAGARSSATSAGPTSCCSRPRARASASRPPRR